MISPDYRRLGQLRDLCPGVPMAALSATAAPGQADILRLLNREPDPLVPRAATICITPCVVGPIRCSMCWRPLSRHGAPV